MKKVYLSPSKVNSLRICEAAFVHRYVLRTPPTGGGNPSRAVGQALDAGAEFDLSAVATALDAGAPRAGADLPLAAVQDIAADAYEAASDGHGSYQREDGTVTTTEEPPIDFALHDSDRGRLKDVSLNVVVPAWYTQHAPLVQPAKVQQWVSFTKIDVDADLEIVMRARLDVLPRDGVLVDVKHTSKDRYTKVADADVDDQLTACDLGYRTLTGEAPTALGWDTVRYAHRGPTKTMPDRDTYEVVDAPQVRVPPRTEAALDSYFERLDRDAERALALIKGDVRPRFADRDSWACSKRWCSVWGACSQGGGKIKV